MLDLTKQMLLSQFEASLWMFADTLRKCPEEHWGGRIGNNSYWYVAYHTLFFTDLYLSVDQDAFVMPAFATHDDREHSEETWQGDPPVRQQMIGHIDFVRDKAEQMIAAEDEASMRAPAGFHWLKQISRAELYVYNIRHLHSHSGQLSAYLRKNCGTGAEWARFGWK